MSNDSHSKEQSRRFRKVDVGQAVILDNDYLIEHHRDMKIEAIVIETMRNAEADAQKLLEETNRKADQILKEARDEAARILEKEGYQQRDSVKKDASEEGFQAGFEEGIREASQQATDKLRTSELVLEQALEAQRVILSKNKEKIIELLKCMLKLILAHECRTTADQMAGLIEKAVEQVQFSGSAKIVINPESFQALKEYSPATMSVLATLHRLNFQLDSNCAPDEMYLETVESSFNISAESQAEILLKAVEQRILISEDVLDSEPDYKRDITSPVDFIPNLPSLESDEGRIQCAPTSYLENPINTPSVGADCIRPERTQDSLLLDDSLSQGEREK